MFQPPRIGAKGAQVGRGLRARHCAPKCACGQHAREHVAWLTWVLGAGAAGAQPCQLLSFVSCLFRINHQALLCREPASLPGEAELRGPPPALARLQLYQQPKPLAPTHPTLMGGTFV